jgi:RsiW-degrading membrane proteinase PrsW (M82 family)
MTDNRDPLAMPVPRDHDDLTFSEMVPFRSSKIDLKRSPALYFLLLLAISVPMMFPALQLISSAKSEAELMNTVRGFSLIMTFVIVAMLQTMMFFYARTDRSFFHFWLPFVFASVALATPIFQIYMYVFRTLWPFWNPQAQSFVPAFLSMFSGAGLCEELTKATPILLGAWLGIRAKSDAAMADNKLVGFLTVRGPLDGALMGIFAGGGFTFIETGIEYVPQAVQQISQETQNMGTGIAGAFLLLIPRALGAAIGHMAYSGIFGYFIGLAVLRPKSAVKLLAIGLLSSATIHGLWNSVGYIHPLLQYVIAGISALGLASVMLKARQLEMAQTGAGAGSFGSIVVDRVAPRPAAAPAFAPPPPVPTPQMAAAPEVLALDVEGMQVPLRANGSFDLSTEPALGGRGAGVTGTIVPHPTRANVLGLRNSGTVPWTARLRDGSQQQIDREQNIRLAPGITIAFGNGLFGSVVKLG